MSNIDVSELVEFQRQIYDKVKDTVVEYDKTANQDVYESILKIFGEDIPDNHITLDMLITCLEIVKKASADKADTVLNRFLL